MTAPRCPHCQTVLPEQATFCAACGNRIEGWSQVPVVAAPTMLPGGQEPTTNMQPTPSLLRAAALSKKKPEEPKRPTVDKPVETDSAVMRSVKHPPFPLWALLGGVAVVAAGLAYWLARRPPPPEPAPVVASAPPASPQPAAAVPAPAPPAKRRVRAHRIEPLQVVTRAPDKRAGDTSLPHKSVATDSKPKVDSGAAAAAVTSALRDAPPGEEETLSDADLKKQAEARIDADGVRFVVKSHLSQVHACYERSFKESSPGGRVEIGFAIAGDGSARRVRTESNSTGSESLANCLEARVKSWEFPRPIGGEYELIYPFVFAQGM
jgi:hypothetical protein